MPEPSPQVLLVGHCGPDAYALRSALNSMVPSARVSFVGDQAALDAALKDASLLLVNRALDGDFPFVDGVELIRSLASKGSGPPMMLISNYPEAQLAAQAAGALPGFGKREMYADKTRQLIQAALRPA